MYFQFFHNIVYQKKFRPKIPAELLEKSDVFFREKACKTLIHMMEIFIRKIPAKISEIPAEQIETTGRFLHI